MPWPPPLSAYDQTVPHPSGRPELAERFAELRAARTELGRSVDPRDVRQVAVVCSSSRGGSTHLEALLREVPGVLTLPGEINPLVVVAQLGELPHRGAVLAEELGLQIGRPARDVRGEDDQRLLALDIAWRLLAQQPDRALPAARVEQAVRDALAGTSLDAAGLTRAVLDRLDVPLAGYDVPDAAPPPLPPSDALVEMTPFVPLRPWRAPTGAELRDGTLLLATPRLVYRLDWLRAVFPTARLRLVHLVRNPAAAVNGLVDGWQHPGFATVAMPHPLTIPGYSDRVPGGERWWKFDVPPSWGSLVDRPLRRVCAAQWCDAHERVLAETRGEEVLRIRHEDLAADDGRSREPAEQLAEFLGLDRDAVVQAVCAGAPPVVATAPPRPARWRRRADELADVLADPGVLDLAERLGVGTDPDRWE